MTHAQAKRLTYGFDPTAWLLYADWLEENAPSLPLRCELETAIWRRRGRVGMAFKAWLDENLAGVLETLCLVRLSAYHIELDDETSLDFELTSQLLRVEIYCVKLKRQREGIFKGSEMTVSTCIGLHQLRRRKMDDANYLRRRVCLIADRCARFPKEK